MNKYKRRITIKSDERMNGCIIEYSVPVYEEITLNLS